jgi:hypothetical protein
MTYRYDKAMATSEIVQGRRNITLSDVDRKILKNIYDVTSKFRSWEKKKFD